MGRRRKQSVPRTLAVIVQDKSGSMANRTAATISGFNEYKNTLRREARGQVLLTLTQFDSSVSRVHSAVPISDVPDLNHGSYVAGGMTALYDAVGQAVLDAERASRKTDKVLVVIMTDGGENVSREWRHDTILSLFERKRADGWEFVFLGAGEEAWATGRSLGFDWGTSINYGSDVASASGVYAAMATSTLDYSQGKQMRSSLASNTLKAQLETDATSANTTATSANTTAKVVNTSELDPESAKS